MSDSIPLLNLQHFMGFRGKIFPLPQHLPTGIQEIYVLVTEPCQWEHYSPHTHISLTEDTTQHWHNCLYKC